MRSWTIGLAVLAAGCGRAPPEAATAAPELRGTLPVGFEGRPYRGELFLDPPSQVPALAQIIEGRLPPGLDLVDGSPERLAITGVPLDRGSFSFVLDVRVATPRVRDLRRAFDIPIELAVSEARLELRTVALPGGVLGAPYEARLEATGGVPPYRFLARSMPPEGLRIEPDGLVRGIPQRLGTQRFEVRLEDAIGQSLDAFVELEITTEDRPRVTTTLEPARAGRSYSVELVGEGGDGGPYRWRLVQGRFPPGLDLRLRRGSTVELSGVPNEPGRFEFVLELEDGDGARGETELALEIVPPLFLVTEELPDGLAGRPYAAPIVAENVLPPLSVRRVGGRALPAGLELRALDEETFVLTGTPVQLGAYRFTLEIRDATDVLQRRYDVFIRRP